MKDEIAFNLPYEEVIPLAVMALSEAGLRVVWTSDLHMALDALPPCECPHHGNLRCDCQYAQLVVFGSRNRPVMLVAHGHEGRSWIVVGDCPDQDTDLKGRIVQALSTSRHTAGTLS